MRAIHRHAGLSVNSIRREIYILDNIPLKTLPYDIMWKVRFIGPVEVGTVPGCLHRCESVVVLHKPWVRIGGDEGNIFGPMN